MGANQAQAIEEDVWTLALQRVRHAYELFDYVAVAFSGGKDSTCALHCTLEIANELGRTPVPVVFFDEEVIPQETEDYMRRIAARPDVDLSWFCLPFRHRNACSLSSPFWYPWAPEARDSWARPLPPEAITDHPMFPADLPVEDRMDEAVFQVLMHGPHLGSVGMVMGIRAGESLTRMEALLRTTTEPYLVRQTGPIYAGNFHKVYPVYDWTETDVWTAPAVFQWDYNRAYDAMEMAGVTRSMQRCSPAFGEEPLERLWSFAHCFPDIWEKGCGRVPGAAAAARYSRTELYGYRDTPDLPDGWTYPDLILHYIGQHPAELQSYVAEQVRSWIRNHYANTADPILPSVRHPETGVCWAALVKLAMRGDFKRRKRRQGASMSPEAVAKRRVRYDAERAALGL